MSINPFHQFEVYDVIKLSVAGHNISITNSAIFMLSAVLIITAFFYLSARSASIIPGKMQNLAEMIYEFVLNTLDENTSHKGKQFFPFIFSIFTFILTLNLMGMLPYGFTTTAHFIITFALAAIVFILVLLIGFVKHGMHFFSLFTPNGAPKILVPLLFVLELVSFLSRPVILAIRLAGNMLAGHVLLKILASFVIMMGVFGFVPIPFSIIMIGFEVFVALLQAYIFTILSCVYLNDAINLH